MVHSNESRENIQNRVLSSTPALIARVIVLLRRLCHGHRRRHQIQEVVIEKKVEKQMFNIQN